MPGSFRAGCLAGVHLRIHASWLLIIALLTATLALGWYPRTVPYHISVHYWIAGFLVSLLLFVCVLAHELGHSLVARVRGLPVRGITLYMFGGISTPEREPRRASVELQVALAGPAVSILLGFILLPIGAAIGNTLQLVSTTIFYLGVANLLLGFFNLIPGFPLDGGRVFRALLWHATGSLQTATRWTVHVSEGIALVFIFAGVLGFFHGNILAGIWLVFVGWFLFTASLSASTQQVLDMALRGVCVADVMNPAPLTVPITATVDELVHGYLEPHSLHAAPVVLSSQLLGLVSLTDVERVPEEQWEALPVGHVMVPLERIQVIAPDDHVSDVLNLMAATAIHQMPVMQSWHLAGMLNRAAIVHFLEARRGLSSAEAEAGVAREIEALQRAS